jgi:uncharacterized membrane protein YeaQ/YmgE (transglycosylase-associated protein family)
VKWLEPAIDVGHILRGSRRLPEPEEGTMQGLMDLGGGVGWIGTLLIGGLAGWIAEKVMKSDMGLIMNIIVGVIGSYIGAFLANALGLRLSEIFQGWFLGNLIVAAIGAILLLLVFKAFKGRTA